MLPPNTLTLASIALIVGAVVRVLRTKTVGDWLDRLPPTWIKAIPSWAHPWLAVGLGVLLTAVDSKLNGGMATWQEALTTAVAGVLAGGTAVAGHETLGKVVRAIAAPPSPSGGSDTAPPDSQPPTPKLSKLIFGCVIALLIACSPAALQADAALAQDACKTITIFGGTPQQQALCATATDVAVLVASTLDSRGDGGVTPAPAPSHASTTTRSYRCHLIPTTSICATDDELARGFATVAAVKASHSDAGAQ